MGRPEMSKAQMPGRKHGLQFSIRRVLLVLCSMLPAYCLIGCSSRDGALERIQTAGLLRVGLDPSWPPFVFVDPASGDVAGADVDLARAVGARLGVEVQFVASGWDGLYGVLKAGQVDAIVSVLPYDPHRTQEVVYSAAYFDAGPAIVVPAGGVGIEQLVDLAGCTVHVRFGSKGAELARRVQKEIDLVIVSHDTAQEALAALAAAPGASAAIVDGVSARLFLRDVSELRIAGSPLDDETYHIAVNIRAESLQKAIDEALSEMRESGELEQILSKWL